MITLTCSQCERNLKVKDELAGKKVRCPQCKQALEVPGRFSEDATVPPSGARPVEEEATIPPSWSPPPDAEPAQEPEQARANGTDEETEEDLDAAAHYKVAGEIARGGMGAIKRTVDKDICREVAVKFLLNQADDRQRARFVEEAQITGQLEHPNIVPIHQLGVHADGRAFFSMKMVKGRSLADILKDQNSEYTLGRLLNIMISICNALAYAHSRQVIHRDLKPANIMVGDFGEVYVMDWGLAKVLGKEELPPAPSTQIKNKRGREVTMAGAESDSKSQDKVTTHGRGAGDLTQAGAIMGTPAYMPPEQAQGDLDDVDERSDIYSLGAILYEMMTLTPPVGRGGDMLAILMRVVEGEIDPPAERAPERAREGWVPPELSAIALKALAKNPQNRYQSVEELKRDIERFLEGRSVSAKQDSFREMIWKLVKRNKGASITASVALVVLAAIAGIFLKVNYDARVLAETERGKAEDERGKAEVERGKAEVAQNKAEKAYQAYLDQVQDSVPAFLRAAKAALKERQFDDALVQVSLAAKSAPDNAEARLLKGELLITRKRFADAIPELEEHLKLGPAKAFVASLAQLCRKAQVEKTDSPEMAASLVAFAEIFTQAQDYALLDGVLSDLGKNATEVRQRLLKIYRERIEAAWPGKSDNLKINLENRYSLVGVDYVTDLRPLKGIPLNWLNVGATKVRDLEPLKGLPLTWLDFGYCIEIRDFSPLKGMPLTRLNLAWCKIHDLEPLKDMPLVYLNLGLCPQVRDLAPLKDLKLTTLKLHKSPQIRNLEPIRNMPLQRLWIDGTGVTDLTPLQAMRLEDIRLTPKNITQGMEILRGMRGLGSIGIDEDTAWPPKEFWNRYEKGEFKK